MFTDTNTTRASWKAIAGFLLLNLTLIGGALTCFKLDITGPVTHASGGLVDATLQVNAIMALIMAGLFMFRLLKLRPEDVGLVKGKVAQAAVITAGIWCLAQLTQLVLCLVTTGTVTADPLWAKYGFTVVIGWIIGQLFGNALYEEIAYRGFLLKQVYLKFALLGRSPWLRFTSAVLASQVIFALMHVPARLFERMTLWEALQTLPGVLLLGLAFSIVYIRTGNLFLALGIHALNNEPTNLFGHGGSPIVLVFALAVAVLWPRVLTFYSQLSIHDLRPAQRPMLGEGR